MFRLFYILKTIFYISRFDYVSIMTHNVVQRLPLIDLLRGFAILLMVIYHFCYDLFFFDYLDTNFGKGYWIPFRYVIVISFLVLVGVSLRLVHTPAIKWQSLKKRTLQMALACIFVTVSSYFIAPNKLTVFGILHFILLASWLALVVVNRPITALLLGIVVFVLGHVYNAQFFDNIWLHWLGMVENKRPALDYVPVFPWLGPVLWGIFLGSLIQQNKKVREVFAINFANRANWLFSQSAKVLQRAGQHSLVIYLLHQPILFGGFYLLEWFL